LPGRRVMATAQRLWVDPDYLGSGRFAPRGATPLTPTMGRPTDPGENRDPGSDQHLTRILTKEPGLENGLYQFSDNSRGAVGTSSLRACSAFNCTRTMARYRQAQQAGRARDRGDDKHCLEPPRALTPAAPDPSL